ncbi:MAG: hypothetical protein ACFFFG_06525 [Candidatus Thorarchaeota archaeon]
MLENVGALIEHSLSGVAVNKIWKTGSLGLNVFQNSIAALFNRDISKTNENIGLADPVKVISRWLKNFTYDQESDVAMPPDNIVEGIKRPGKYSEILRKM